MLSEALQLWSLVSQTEALPTPPTSHGNNISNKTVSSCPDNIMILCLMDREFSFLFLFFLEFGLILG
jgi:hypothetical protein